MKGREEDVFVGILKEQLKLECELEEVKEDLILYCNDFNPVQAFRIFVPNAEKAHRNITVHNTISAFSLFDVSLSLS